MQYSHPPNSPLSTLEKNWLGTLTLEVVGLRNQTGLINIAVFRGADGFPGDPGKAVRSGSFAITTLPLMIQFSELPIGSYAISAHHDENMDATLNCNALGIPKEGIGFSGNPKIWRGAPSFQRSLFEFTPSNTFVSITMKYLLP
ncbi:DUF2141 domain-containing protein [Thermocoleostomius sinensis]|uniref:DUF2141 domain-containing protein n=1 Tax=Thermocoleostomius sinensis A174 TaxID=2016057 RepID=A0A9E8ZGQ8_9CYAN|nr:DUF2141 domain-containing protein [Thermocoleostomius sinensis]WAL58226.1 DUF2141 domain-containing protein [Thermocoleostomius sinensis A174]